MKLRSLFKKSDTEILLLKQNTKAIVFYLKNGKGLLYEKCGYYQNHGLCCLFWGAVPLIKFHGDEHMCPTCEQLVCAGYGLDSTEESKLLLGQLGEKLNAPYTDIETSFNHLKPLLGLLQTGYYQLSDEALFPTDGNGRFFWAIDNTPSVNPATAPAWDADRYSYSSPKPHYLLPSQVPGRFNMHRVQHYQQQDSCRAVAYYHCGSYLCTLLDGHHKATAAALQAKPVNTLVISGPQSIVYPHDKPTYFQFSHFTLTEKECITSFKRFAQHNDHKRMTDEETQAILNLQNAAFDSYPWSDDILATSAHYPDTAVLDTLEFAGDLSEKRLHDILANKETVCASTVGYITNALFITQSQMAAPFAMQIYQSGLYKESWQDLFTQLSQHPSAEVSQFFLEFLIDDDGERPWLTKIANAYLDAFSETSH